MCPRKGEEAVCWVARAKMVHSRMVRENPLGSQTRKQAHNPETQGEDCEEAAGASSEKADTERGEFPDRQLELHNWNREPGTSEEHDWRQALDKADVVSLPTHLHPFSCPEEYRLVRQTYQQLMHSGYYWGALSMEEAHAMLSEAQLGTFLIRDSVQPDVFFTLSYRRDDGPTSVRVILNKKLLFSLFGSLKTFDSLFALLTHYTGPSGKLTAPHRKQRPERLTEICRRTLVGAYGADNIRTLSGLSSKDKHYIYLYPYSI